MVHLVLLALTYVRTPGAALHHVRFISPTCLIMPDDASLTVSMRRKVATIDTDFFFEGMDSEDEQALKRRFHQLAAQFHPDRVGADGYERFQALNAEYTQLRKKCKTKKQRAAVKAAWLALASALGDTLFAGAATMLRVWGESAAELFLLASKQKRTFALTAAAPDHAEEAVAATAGLDGVVVPTGAATRRAEEAEEAHAQATAAAAEGLRVRCLALVDEGDAIIARRTAIAAQEVVVMSRIRTAARRQEEEAEEEATRLAAVASAAEAEAEVPDEYIAMYMSPGTSLTAAEWALSMPDDPSPAVSMPAIEMPMEIANAEVNVLAAPGADSAMSAPAAQSVSIPGGWALSIPAESPTAIESPPPEVSVLAAPVAAPDVDSMLCSDGVEGAERADSRARRPRESRRQAKERQRRSEMVGKVVPAPARGKSKKQRRAAMIGGDLLSSKSRACD